MGCWATSSRESIPNNTLNTRTTWGKLVSGHVAINSSSKLVCEPAINSYTRCPRLKDEHGLTTIKAGLLQMSTAVSLCMSQLRFLHLKTNQLEVAVASHSSPCWLWLKPHLLRLIQNSVFFFCRYPIAKLKATNILAPVSTVCCFNNHVRGAEK